MIYFVDSSHPQHQTRLAYGWIEKGIRKPGKMTACQKRINLIGAINLDNHDVLHRQVKWVNGESIEAFLQQLIDANPDLRIFTLFGTMQGIIKANKSCHSLKAQKLRHIICLLTRQTLIQ